ncbi:hypothetical protein KASHIRA_02400 [Serratia phage vB_SmaM-Kashira]|nr:hypothetical protein KASHIRA_02400 [Serratia phage vB_SmaM-Kashira]
MAKKEFTHTGKISNTLGWGWSEQLRDGGQKYWVSAVQCSTGKITKYRKTDGKAVGLDQWLDLESIYESR